MAAEYEYGDTAEFCIVMTDSIFQEQLPKKHEHDHLGNYATDDPYCKSSSVIYVKLHNRQSCIDTPYRHDE